MATIDMKLVISMSGAASPAAAACAGRELLMSRVLITGSTEGLGLMAARLLAEDGHSVTLHARSAARARDARAALPAARAAVVGDLSSIAGMRQVAEQANAGGRYDAVIHNAGVGYREPRRSAPMTAWNTSSRSTSSPRTC